MPTSEPSSANNIESLPRVRRTSVEQMFQSIEQPVAFVGNGKIGQEYGCLIDQHASILRCNNFVLDGYSTKVGTKTTHWCIHGKVDQVALMPRWKQFFVNLFSPKRTVGIRPNKHIHPEVKTFMPKAFEALVVEQCKKHLGVELYCVEDASLLYPVHHELPFATTGFVALYLLVQFVSEVSVFGVSGLQGGHYSNPQHRHTKRHKAGALRELELIANSERIKLYQ